MKIKNETCNKCGIDIETPDYDETRPISEYFPKWERALLKHGWQHHRSDFPPEFKSFTKFMKWSSTPDGKEWNRKQGRWRNKVLNGFVTLYCRGVEDEPRKP